MTWRTIKNILRMVRDTIYVLLPIAGYLLAMGILFIVSLRWPDAFLFCLRAFVLGFVLVGIGAFFRWVWIEIYRDLP